jgi:long-chain acyl-CoA synthetase
VIGVHFASVPDRRAELDPDGRAVSDSARSLTNTELLEQVCAAAEHLRDLGIGAGDVVALKLTNCLEFVVLLFATWRLGATVTPVNPSLTDGEVARQLDDSRACVLIVEDDTAASGQVASIAIGDLRRAPQGPVAEPEEDAAAVALLIYTSGTTGIPKGGHARPRQSRRDGGDGP